MLRLGCTSASPLSDLGHLSVLPSLATPLPMRELVLSLSCVAPGADPSLTLLSFQSPPPVLKTAADEKLPLVHAAVLKLVQLRRDLETG